MFKNKTVAELENLQSELKLAIAEAKRVEQAVAEVEARKAFTELKEGALLTVKLKGAEEEAQFVKLTDKRVIVTVAGEKKTIMFHNVVRVH